MVADIVKLVFHRVDISRSTFHHKTHPRCLILTHCRMTMDQETMASPGGVTCQSSEFSFCFVYLLGETIIVLKKVHELLLAINKSYCNKIVISHPLTHLNKCLLVKDDDNLTKTNG